MDSQQSAGNAVETPSDREINAVKSNPTPPPNFRARPQGPPGLPRYPINNGPIGQPRLAGQPQLIRFENRPQIGPSNLGQAVQLRPYGSPRPPGGSFPQRPPNQGHNPPIILNPRFPSSPGQRPGPPSGPRQLHPGNYQSPQFPGNHQRTNSPNQNLSQQQVRKPELARPPEIAQRQPQRNESSLNTSQPDLLPREEDKRPAPPRIVIDKMADVDNSKKLQQCENVTPLGKSELHENADNDDDDDVVMDGKSPRANGDATTREEEKGADLTVKRPETATINGKICNKSENVQQAAAGIIADTCPNPKVKQSIQDSSSVEADNRLRSTNEGAQKDEISKANSKLGEKAENQIEGKIKTTKENHSAETVATPKLQDATDKSAGAEQLYQQLEAKHAEQSKEKLIWPPKSPENSRATVPTIKVNETKPPQLQAAESQDKSSNKSSFGGQTKPSHDPSEREQNASSKSQDVSSETAAAQTNPCPAERKPEASKSPQLLQNDPLPTKGGPNEGEDASARKSEPSAVPSSEPHTVLETAQDKNDRESKIPSENSNKSHSAAAAEENLNQDKQGSEMPSKTPNRSLDALAAEMDKQKNEEELKVDTRQSDKLNVNATSETKGNNGKSKQTETECKSETPAPRETKRDSNKPSKLEKPKSETVADRDRSLNEKNLKNVEKSRESKVLETDSPDQLIQNSSELHVAPSSLAPASKKEESKKTQSLDLKENHAKAPECVISPAESPEAGVKGFDNGQERSLSVKSPVSQNLRSPTSPKTPKSPKSPRLPKSPKPSKSPSDNEKVMPESKAGLKSTAKAQRAPSPAAMDEKSGKHISAAPEVQNGSETSESAQSNAANTSGSAACNKKLPMNKVQVGAAPSPNLKTVRSKIGSFDNASYKPGGGKVKIENRKLDFSKAQPKIAAKNEKYTPSGGDKKIAQVKLQWNAKPKVGSLENATYKPGGGDKKIETVKLDFKDKAKPKVGSKENAKHVPGGGSVKSSATPPKTPQDANNDIQTQKIDIKAESKVGSLDNVKHKPGGGEKKIFNDRDYLRQTGSNVESLSSSGSQNTNADNANLPLRQAKNDLPQPPPSTPTKKQKLPSPSSMVTAKAVRNSLAKSPEATGLRKHLPSVEITEVKEKKKSLPDPATTKDKRTKSPTTAHSAYTDQPKNLEDTITKSCSFTNSSDNSEVKNSEGPATKPSNLAHSSNSSRLKSPRKSVTQISRKLSPKELRLPKLARSPTPQENNTNSDPHAKVKLPKLIERVTH